MSKRAPRKRRTQSHRQSRTATHTDTAAYSMFGVLVCVGELEEMRGTNVGGHENCPCAS